MDTVVSDSDHAGAEDGRETTSAVDYERAVSQASDLVLAHLKACPDDRYLSLGRHDDGPTLYSAVGKTFPEIERMRLTSLMWEHVANHAIAAFAAARGDEPSPEGGDDQPAGA